MLALIAFSRRRFPNPGGLLAIVSVFVLMAPSLTASEPRLAEGSSHRDAREQALKSVPFASLTPEAADKIRPVLEDPSIFRRMPAQTILCDAEIFNTLVRYPEILVEIWQLMGMTRVTTQRTGPFNFQGEDGAGTTCRNELILGSESYHIYYSEGDYEGGLVARKLEGRCVCLVHAQPSLGEQGQALMTAHMDVFLKLDNIGADLVAKTIGPLVVKTADYNYIETLRFVSQLSTAAQRDPSAVEQLTSRLRGLRPEVKQRFVLVAQRAAERRERVVAMQMRRSADSLEQEKETGKPMALPDNATAESKRRYSIERPLAPMQR